MKKNSLITLFLLWSVYLIAQDTKLPVFITDSLDNYITKGIEEWNIPGLSVAIVKDGKVVLMKGYGVTKVGGSIPVNENTLFMIGSNTKAFTAVSLSILQESGVISLNDKVQKWMPDFRLKDPLASKNVEIVDLLSHRIGFEAFQGDFTFWTSNLTREQVINKMSLIDPPYGFRTKWGYSNAAFVAAGQLIPRIIGRSWEATVRDSILIPLKMNSTLMLAEELKNAQNIAYPHTVVDDRIVEIPFANIDNLGPAGSMSSNAKDMSRWLFAQLENGKVDEKQIISPNVFENIRNPYSIIAFDPRDGQQTHFYLYGLGISINDKAGKLVYSHAGGIDGFLSFVMFVPEEKLGIVVLTNTNHNKFFQSLGNEILGAFLDLPYQGYSYKSLKSYKTNKVNSDNHLDSLRRVIMLNNKPSLSLSQYVGKYNNDVYGDIEVRLENGKLNIYFSNHPDLVGKLDHIQNDSFLCVYSNPSMGIFEIPFKIKDGKVMGLTLRVSDFIEFTPYEFKKI
ncbi:MAG: serine hydrolase [Bacteroidales bacterium]